MTNLNTELYSRQIYAYGIDTMKKIMDLNILIIGLRGIGLEVAKNIILEGPKLVSIYDNTLCLINDMGSNFYIEQSDINIKSRDEACINKLKSLNPYVDVNICKNNNIISVIKNYNFIIITEIMNTEKLFEINNICRNNNIGFIYCSIYGLSGFCFNDFGNSHIISDETGLNNYKYYINNIEIKDNTYEIFLENKENMYFDLRDDDYIIFKGIKGIESLNDGKPRQIKLISNNHFIISRNNKNDNEKYICNGIIEEVKLPQKYSFIPLKKSFYNPFINEKSIIIDQSKKYKNVLLHCAIIGLHKYYDKYNKLPELNNMDQTKEVFEYSFNYYNDLKKLNIDCLKTKKNKIIDFDKNYIEKVIRWSRSEINPICTFLGGIIAQEIIKITGKYKPIYQWLRFDFFETVNNIPDNSNRELLNNRYDDQIAIFGQDLQNKLSQLNIFLIGAGALGCEYLKNFALMGISTSNNSYVSITDNDNIETSNLSRQFLFRNIDVGKNKSKCAAEKVKEINKNFNIISLNELVSDKTKDIFNDYFWEKNNLVISAVDNLKARQYIDKQCIFYSIPFIDSGTEGVNANCDIYYPKKTICFNDIKINEKKKDIPMCTLKDFPYEIEHCVEASKIYFEKLFEQYIKELQMIINDKKKFEYILNTDTNENEKNFKLINLDRLNDIIDKPNLYNIIDYIITNFIEFYNLKINIILEKYPVNMLNDNGSLFWSGIKKIPHPLIFDIEDEMILLYVKSYINIISKIINFDNKYNINEIQDICRQIKYNYKINKEIINIKSKIFEKIGNNKNKINLIKCIKFNKDNEDHINFLLSSSNLRARNYNINECDLLKIKQISGNIIPAILTTTAAITGLASMQIYTLIQTDNIKLLRCSCINLGTSDYDLSIPESVKYISNDNGLYKLIPEKFTIWDKIDLQGPLLTIKNIIDYFKINYDIEIDFINSGEISLACPFIDDEDLLKTIEELYISNFKIKHDIKYIELSINGRKENLNIKTPTIKYIMK